MIQDIHCLFNWQDIPEYFFVWTDTAFETPQGLTRVLYNHGRFYVINEFILAGFPLNSDIIMVWGRLEADLMKKHYPDKKIIISGNPIFNDIEKKEFKVKSNYNIMFVPNHWDSSSKKLELNQNIFDYLINNLPDHNIMVKTTQDIEMLNSERLELKTNTEDENGYSIIKKFLYDHVDICVCLDNSTFAMFAHLTGIPVICIKHDLYENRLFNNKKIYMYDSGTSFHINLENIAEIINNMNNWTFPTDDQINYELKRPAITDKELYESLISCI